MSKGTSTSRLAFRPDIEGLRGIAVFLVVAFHAGVTWLPGGFVGVDIFFVISGYLISGLLIEERLETGKIAFVRFYARRIRRLMPAAMLTIAATLLAGSLLLSPLEMKEIAKSGMAAALSASNIWFGIQATDYFAADIRTNPFLHTWSLAVEEQFYVLWPLLILLLCSFARSHRKLAIWIGLLSIPAFIACILVTETQQRWAFYGTPLRAWEFGLGAFAYLLRPAADNRPRRHDDLLAWAGLAIIVASSALIHESGDFPGAIAFFPVFGTALVLYALSARPNEGLGYLLATPPMQFLGRLSYSWYLWHWPILTIGVVWFGESAGAAERIGLAAAALAVSALAFRFVEDPIRRHRALLPRNSFSLALGAGLIAAGLGVSALAFLWSDRVMNTDPVQQTILAAVRDVDKSCPARIEDGKAVECSYGPAGSGMTMAIIGDSHAEQWLPPLARTAKARGWHLAAFIKPACPAVTADVFSAILNRAYHECSEWREAALARLVELKPDAVLLASSYAYVIGQGRHSGYATLSYDDWAAALTKTVSRLSDAGIPVLMLRDNPQPPFDIPICLSRAVHAGRTMDSACEFARSGATDQRIADIEAAVIGAHQSTRYLDMTDRYCDAANCQSYREGRVLYRDNNHLTGHYAASTIDDIADALKELADTARDR